MVRSCYFWTLVLALGTVMLMAATLPASAQATGLASGWGRCCVFTPAQGTNDPELTSLADQIVKRMELADREILAVLCDDQEFAFNADSDDLNFQFFKTHCVSRDEANVYVAQLSPRLRLTARQQCRIKLIEYRLVDELSPLLQAYCARYQKWMVERYNSTRIAAIESTRTTTESVVPYSVGGKVQPRAVKPMPSRKIPRDRDVK